MVHNRKSARSKKKRLNQAKVARNPTPGPRRKLWYDKMKGQTVNPTDRSVARSLAPHGRVKGATGLEWGPTAKYDRQGNVHPPAFVESGIADQYAIDASQKKLSQAQWVIPAKLDVG